MLQIQLQMIRCGAAVSVTNNENDEHKRNDWSCTGGYEDRIERQELVIPRGNCYMMPRCPDFLLSCFCTLTDNVSFLFVIPLIDRGCHVVTMVSFTLIMRLNKIHLLIKNRMELFDPWYKMFVLFFMPLEWHRSVDDLLGVLLPTIWLVLICWWGTSWKVKRQMYRFMW